MHEMEAITANRANWDDRADVHARSHMYDVDRFLADKEDISTVVQNDLAILTPTCRNQGFKVAHFCTCNAISAPTPSRGHALVRSTCTGSICLPTLCATQLVSQRPTIARSPGLKGTLDSPRH